jgi:hypothetical protein
MIDTKKRFFSTDVFFWETDFLNTVKLSDMASLFLKRASIPKNTSPFPGGVVGNFFEDIFILSVQISIW